MLKNNIIIKHYNYYDVINILFLGLFPIHYLLFTVIAVCIFFIFINLRNQRGGKKYLCHKKNHRLVYYSLHENGDN